VLIQFFSGSLAIRGLDHLKAFHADEPGEEGAKFFFVVDEEDVFQRPGWIERVKVRGRGEEKIRPGLSVEISCRLIWTSQAELRS